MQRLTIQCPYCRHTDTQWPADVFPQGQHEHACVECLSQFIATRTGDTVTTRRFEAAEKATYPRPTRTDAHGDRIHRWR